MKNRYATAYNVCATRAWLPPAHPFFSPIGASLSLRVALLTGALTKTKGEPALSLLQPANWQAYGSANRSGHGWRKLVRSAEN